MNARKNRIFKMVCIMILVMYEQGIAIIVAEMEQDRRKRENEYLEQAFRDMNLTDEESKCMDSLNLGVEAKVGD